VIIVKIVQIVSYCIINVIIQVFEYPFYVWLDFHEPIVQAVNPNVRCGHSEENVAQITLCAPVWTSFSSYGLSVDAASQLKTDWKCRTTKGEN